MLMVGVSTKPPFGGLFRGRGSLSGTQTSYEGTAANVSPLPNLTGSADDNSCSASGSLLRLSTGRRHLQGN